MNTLEGQRYSVPRATLWLIQHILAISHHHGSMWKQHPWKWKGSWFSNVHFHLFGMCVSVCGCVCITSQRSVFMLMSLKTLYYLHICLPTFVSDLIVPFISHFIFGSPSRLKWVFIVCLFGVSYLMFPVVWHGLFIFLVTEVFYHSLQFQCMYQGKR